MTNTTYTENHLRSISKVISWRVVLTASHVINGFIVSGSWATGIQIALLATIINSFIFWAHERGWNFVQWNRKPTDNILFFEGQPRTISKSVTWRILITISNFTIPFIMTGSWGSAFAFLGIATLVNIVIFYTHERVWNRILWGKTITEIA
jgi:uncharacterized membrane protein